MENVRKSAQLTMSSIRPAKSSDLAELSELAGRIWREHYVPIIGAEQVEYMLGLWYNLHELQKQLAEEQRLFIVAELDGELKAYMQASPIDGFMFIHKVYVAQECRGMGIARALFAELPAKLPLKLRVNRDNSDSIKFYKRYGFYVVGEDVLDIGKGFVMDDYVMEKAV